jgi:hypothetical protein
LWRKGTRILWLLVVVLLAAASTIAPMLLLCYFHDYFFFSHSVYSLNPSCAGTLDVDAGGVANFCSAGGVANFS